MAQKDYKAIVRKAKKCPHGWADGGQTGRSHNVLVNQDGARIVYPCSSSDRFGPANFAKDLERACGCKFTGR